MWRLEIACTQDKPRSRHLSRLRTLVGSYRQPVLPTQEPGSMQGEEFDGVQRLHCPWPCGPHSSPPTWWDNLQASKWQEGVWSLVHGLRLLWELGGFIDPCLPCQCSMLKQNRSSPSLLLKEHSCLKDIATLLYRCMAIFGDTCNDCKILNILCACNHLFWAKLSKAASLWQGSFGYANWQFYGKSSEHALLRSSEVLFLQLESCKPSVESCHWISSLNDGGDAYKSSLPKFSSLTHASAIN